MKKPKQTKTMGRKNETEFASSITPDIGGGQRSKPHSDRLAHPQRDPSRVQEPGSAENRQQS